MRSVQLHYVLGNVMMVLRKLTKMTCYFIYIFPLKIDSNA